jgi:hypothetical protein
MMKIIKGAIVFALFVMSCLWAYDKFGAQLFEKAGGITADSNLAAWNNASAVERDAAVRGALSDPQRISKIADCITIMATVSESQSMTIREVVPFCQAGLQTKVAVQNMMNNADK